MVVFHSYVSLPEGTIQGEQQHRRKHRTSVHDVLVVSQILAMTRELRCQWIAVAKNPGNPCMCHSIYGIVNEFHNLNACEIIA